MSKGVDKMKKKYIIIILLFIFACINVQARENAEKMTLMSVDTPFDIDTSVFEYKSIKYNPNFENQKYGVIDIDSIYNKTDKKKPISFNIMLFDNKMDCIGYVSYCSTKEIDTDYSQSYIKSKEKTAVIIPVDSKYLLKGYKKTDVAYMVFVDDNSACKINDKDKYAGLTLYSIETGKISKKYNKNSLENKTNEIINIGLPKFLEILLIIGFIYTVLSFIISDLYNKMFNKDTVLAWIPVLNTIPSMRTAFGSIVAIIYFVFLLLSLFTAIALNSTSLLIIAVLILVVSILINLIKLFTGQYGLLYFDPTTSYSWQKVSKVNINVDNTVMTTQPPTLINEVSGEVGQMDLTMVSATPTMTSTASVNTQEEIDTQPIVIDDVDDLDDKEDDFDFQ